MEHQDRKIIYFVRHGQSMDNTSPVFQSELSPLSEEGRRQARRIAGRLSRLPFESVISSPMPRAHQTAQYIGHATGKEIVLSDLFVERVKPSDVDGQPWTDAKATRQWRAWLESLYRRGVHVGDSENYDDVVTRADKVLEFLLERPERTLVVVTHGWFLRVLVARVLLGERLTGRLLKQFQDHTAIQNTALTVLKYADAFEEDYAWRLWTLNDHAHVAEKD